MIPALGLLPVPQGSGHDRASRPRALDGLLRRPYQRQPAAGSAALRRPAVNEHGWYIRVKHW